jgi:hypothetical protein
VGVFQGQLGLADPTQPIQRLGRYLDRGRPRLVKTLAQLAEEVVTACEGDIPPRQVGDRRPATGIARPPMGFRSSLAWEGRGDGRVDRAGPDPVQQPGGCLLCRKVSEVEVNPGAEQLWQGDRLDQDQQ